MIERALAVVMVGCFGCGSAIRQHEYDAAVCEGQRDYACAESHYTWMIEHGHDGPGVRVSRAFARLQARNRAGAIEDVNRAVGARPSMANFNYRANILSDLGRIRQIGLRDASDGASPPLDLEAAIADFTRCIQMAPGNPGDREIEFLTGCFKGRRDLRAALGQDSSSDDEAFRRVGCDACGRGTAACDRETGCSLNMGTSSAGPGGAASSSSAETSSSSPGASAGAWYYSWSCTGQCSPGALAIKGTEGPFPSEDGCNSVRNNDSHRALVQQSGNVGSIGYCERR